MTVMIEPPSLADRILACFGKKRAVCFPKTSNPDAYCVAHREGFFCALCRPKGKPLPEGMAYWDEKDSEQQV